MKTREVIESVLRNKKNAQKKLNEFCEQENVLGILVYTHACTDSPYVLLSDKGRELSNKMVLTVQSFQMFKGWAGLIPSLKNAQYMWQKRVVENCKCLQDSHDGYEDYEDEAYSEEEDEDESDF